MRVLVAIIPGLAVLAQLAGCRPPDPTVHETPVSVISETVGFGRPAEAGDTVTINYRVLLPDGQVVLRDRDFPFQLRTGAVILGLDEAVEGMRRRGRRVVQCPPHKHWGRPGYGEGAIPPNVTLTFEIELIEID
ncbi:MAG: FKBP-type peptidyl-prolyl cis-trans isomerase [Planctomycetota bacterium]